MADDLIDVADDGSILLRLHVTPGAGRSSVGGRHGSALRVKVAAPPRDGRANEACLAAVATAFGVARDAVELVSGATSRDKRICIRGADADDLRRLLSALVAPGARPDDAGRPGRPRRSRP